MKIGFTGTRNGMTEFQKKSLDKFLRFFALAEFHHGCCVGADEEAHELAKYYYFKVVLHPPTDIRQMAENLRGAKRCRPLPYLERNHKIVDSTEILIAAPETTAPVLRSGTWATIRYARTKGHPVYILLP